MKTTINPINLVVVSVQTHATKSRDVRTQTMTKLLNLGRVSVKANIAQLCYAVAKTTTNSIKVVVASVQSNPTSLRNVKMNQSSILAMEHQQP